MSYVGYVTKLGKRVGLVRSGSELIRVKVGDRLGNQGGRVVSLEEAKMLIEEIYVNEAGKKITRTQALNLSIGTNYAQKP